MPDHRPVVANVCLDFLKRDMLHIYRQITGLEAFRPVVLARKRENADCFPFNEKEIALLPRPRSRELRRFWMTTIRRRPVQIYFGEVKEMLYQVLQFDAEVVHIYFGNVAVQLLPFIRACPRPVVVSFHGADVGVDAEMPRYRARLTEVLQRADLVLARSEALLRDLAELGCPGEKLRLHRTGIPLGRWRFHERTVPPTHGRWHFVQACRLVEKKGIPVALEAFAHVAERFPGARFTIAGDGPMRAELEALVESRRLSTKVDFPGFLKQKDLFNLLYDAHVFIHPSQTGADGNREGVPNAMLEAMASGMPVLATRHGGIPEAVDDGVAGFLVDEGDAAALAGRALELCENSFQYKAFATNARKAIAERFERGSQCRLLDSYYQEAIELGAAQRSARHPC